MSQIYVTIRYIFKFRSTKIRRKSKEGGVLGLIEVACGVEHKMCHPWNMWSHPLNIETNDKSHSNSESYVIIIDLIN